MFKLSTVVLKAPKFTSVYNWSY